MAKTASVKKKRVSLAFDAEPGKNVFVAGDFNEWTVGDDKKAKKMKEKKDQAGHYSIQMYLPVGDHEYKFFCEGEWHPDPAAENHKWNAFGTRNSVMAVA